MDDTIFKIITGISLPGAAAILGYFVLKPLAEAWAQKIKDNGKSNSVNPKNESQLSKIEEQISLISSNHFHDVDEDFRDLKESNRRIESGLTSIDKSLIYIKARINGKL